MGNADTQQKPPIGLFLQRCGCDLLQGYRISKALPAELYEQQLQRNTTLRPVVGSAPTPAGDADRTGGD